MKVWVDKNVNARQPNPNEEDFAYLDSCSEKKKGKEKGKERKGIEKDDGIG